MIKILADIVHGKATEIVNSGLTFLFGGGLGSSVMIVMNEQNIDTALRWGVFIVTIILGIIKAYYMIKNEGKGGKKTP